jgi:ArsR family transcriptional regulator, cadmium/lead-responsive transcriptional repressor
MAMICPNQDNGRIVLAPAAALFRSLGDPVRLAIVGRLAKGEARVRLIARR